jgi:hypothetical protein
VGSSQWIRTLVRRHGAWANIPPRGNRKEALSFARNLVERFFTKIEHCRRVATRYDKLAASTGLDSESLSRVFDAYYTTKPDGMGMGLAIANRPGLRRPSLARSPTWQPLSDSNLHS